MKLLKKVFLKQKNKMIDQLLPVIYMIGVLLLIIPTFLQSNSKLKQFLTNLTIWIIVVLVILSIIYILNVYKKAYLVSYETILVNEIRTRCVVY